MEANTEANTDNNADRVKVSSDKVKFGVLPNFGPMLISVCPAEMKIKCCFSEGQIQHPHHNP